MGWPGRLVPTPPNTPPHRSPGERARTSTSCRSSFRILLLPIAHYSTVRAVAATNSRNGVWKLRCYIILYFYRKHRGRTTTDVDGGCRVAAAAAAAAGDFLRIFSDKGLQQCFVTNAVYCTLRESFSHYSRVASAPRTIRYCVGLQEKKKKVINTNVGRTRYGTTSRWPQVSRPLSHRCVFAAVPIGSIERFNVYADVDYRVSRYCFMKRYCDSHGLGKKLSI